MEFLDLDLPKLPEELVPRSSAPSQPTTAQSSAAEAAARKGKATAPSVGVVRKAAAAIEAEAEKRTKRRKGQASSTPVVIDDAPAPPTSGDRFFLPGKNVLNPQYIIPDVPELPAEMVLRLPPRFSLTFQAIYENVFEKDWEIAMTSPLLERVKMQIRHQCNALVLSLLNYIDLVGVDAKSKELTEVEEGLRTHLEMEKAARQKACEERDQARKERDEAINAANEQATQAATRLSELQKLVDEAKEKYLAQGRLEGYGEGKKAAEEVAVNEYLGSADYQNSLQDAGVNAVANYKVSPEFQQIRMEILQSAGKQVLDKVRAQYPDLDLGFLFKKPPPPASGSTSGGEA